MEKEMAIHSSILAWRIPGAWWATVHGVTNNWTCMTERTCIHRELYSISCNNLQWLKKILYKIFVTEQIFCTLEMQYCKSTVVP